MPYIQCPDGQTYSRYDQRKYVKWCICNKKEQQQKKFNECMQDPTCKKEYLQRRETSQNVIIYGGGLVTILIVVLFWRLAKAT